MLPRLFRSLLSKATPPVPKVQAILHLIIAYNTSHCRQLVRPRFPWLSSLYLSQNTLRGEALLLYDL
jgi:hypothetical protein